MFIKNMQELCITVDTPRKFFFLKLYLRVPNGKLFLKTWKQAIVIFSKNVQIELRRNVFPLVFSSHIALEDDPKQQSECASRAHVTLTTTESYGLGQRQDGRCHQSMATYILSSPYPLKSPASISGEYSTIWIG